MVARRAGMGPGLAACGVVRHRLGHSAVSGSRRRAAADHRLVLWRGAGKGRDRTSLRRRRRQLFGLVFRTSAADRARALQRDPAQRSSRKPAPRTARRARHILDLASRYKGLRHPNRKEAPAFKAELKGIAGECRDHRARARRLSGRRRTAPPRPWRCIICWNASTTSSATGGSPPATSTTGAFSTSIRWPDCGSRMPAPSTPSIAWSKS